MNPRRRLPSPEALCQRLGLHQARGELARRIAGAIPVPTDLPAEQLPLSRVRFWVVDVETTGMGPPAARVIEAAAVEIRGQRPGRTFTSLVNCGVEVPAFISRLTGITPAMLAAAPPPEAVFPLLQRLVQGAALVGHHLAFDLKFLQHEWQSVLGHSLELPCFCTMRLARRVLPELKNHDLDTLARHFGLRFAPAPQTRSRHRALGDALITAEIFLRLLRRLRGLGVSSLAELSHFQELPLAKAHARLKK